MRKFFNNWRYYGLMKDEYKRCIERIFSNNLQNLFLINTVTAVFAACFAFFPLVIEKKLLKTGIHLASAVIAVLFCFIVKYKLHRQKKGEQAGKKYIYTMIVLYYMNIIFFGIYLGVWANPGKLAVSFMGILICALILFNLPPQIYLLLTLCAMSLFMAAAVLVKNPQDWSLDIVNALFAGCLSLIIGWKITMYRMALASNLSNLEAENTIDALTQLKNRRDFMKTFERYFFQYRPTDNYLCVALMDIDYFKKYNDFYGHLQGDECLRIIGKTLNDLKSSMGIYTARVGGEEFGLLWHKEEPSDIDKTGEKINQIIRDLKIPHEKSNVGTYLTVSIGIHIAKCGVNNDINELYNLADKALYDAKRKGRNCTVIY